MLKELALKELALKELATMSDGVSFMVYL